jgi:hypothetical protein
LATCDEFWGTFSDFLKNFVSFSAVARLELLVGSHSLVCRHNHFLDTWEGVACRMDKTDEDRGEQLAGHGTPSGENVSRKVSQYTPLKWQQLYIFVCASYVISKT